MGKTTNAQPYDQITQVGPGTPAHEILRHHWQPIAVSSELEAGHTQPVRALGVSYTLYRGESGQVYLTEGLCPHRLTVLHAGWVEGEDLRCMYHGWKFDPRGQCVEQPAEPPEYAQSVCNRTWPVQEYAGLIYTYLGDGEAPPLPRIAAFDDPDVMPFASIRPPGVWPYNYFQTLENDVDPVHTTFVHHVSEPHWHGVPEVSCVETDLGMEVTAVRGDFVRKTLFHFPNMLQLTVFPIPEKPIELDMLLYTLPVDDEHCIFFVSVALPKAFVNQVNSGEITPPGQSPMTDQDIKELMTGVRGPRGITDEDYLIMVGQGVNADRARERLGRSDVAIVMLRNIWSRALNEQLNTESMGRSRNR